MVLMNCEAICIELYSVCNKIYHTVAIVVFDYNFFRDTAVITLNNRKVVLMDCKAICTDLTNTSKVRCKDQDSAQAEHCWNSLVRQLKEQTFQNMYWMKFGSVYVVIKYLPISWVVNYDVEIACNKGRWS